MNQPASNPSPTPSRRLGKKSSNDRDYRIALSLQQIQNGAIPNGLLRAVASGLISRAKAHAIAQTFAERHRLTFPVQPANP